MKRIISKSISLVLALAMIISLLILPPIKSRAAGIKDYGKCDNSVTATYKVIDNSKPTENYFEYSLQINNESGYTIRDWIAVAKVKSNINNLSNLASWNQLNYASSGDTLYIYPKNMNDIASGSSSQIYSKFCYSGAEVDNVKVYYSTNANAFDDFKAGGFVDPDIDIIENTVTDYGVDTDTNYAKLLQESLYLFDANMCGSDVSDNSGFLWRDDCHLGDQAVNYNGRTIDVSGGYHDAGDHVKFGLPQAYAANMLGLAYYEYKDDFSELGQSDHALLHLGRFAEYFKKCTVLTDDESEVEAFCYQVGNAGIDHSYWNKPEEQDESQGNRADQAYFTSDATPCTDIVSLTASYLALYSMIANDVESLDYAEKLIKYAEDKDKIVSKNSEYVIPYYEGSSYKDDMALAYYWLNKATNGGYIAKYNNLCENLDECIYDNQCWDSVWGSVIVLSENNDCSKYFKNYVNNKLNKKSTDGYVYIDDAFWGTARYNTNLQFMTLLYDKSNDTDNYSDWATGQMNYLLGNNKNPYCYVVGYNDHTVKHPHHESASGYDKSVLEQNPELAHVLLGALVGGPDSSDNFYDDTNNYKYTEVALDYQVGLVGAAVGLYHIHKNDEGVVKTLLTEEQLAEYEIGKKPKPPVPTPTDEPTPSPTDEPTPSPTVTPTDEPTPSPTVTPTEEPTPTVTPTEEPTPTVTPTEEPTPTVTPTEEPTPTVTPTEEPTPTVTPTEEPTPTVTPTEEPTPTVTPTEEPTPTVTPTEEPTPTVTPTEEPTPTVTPTEEPTPTVTPTEEPTPTVTPTEEPTPTVTPTEEPTPTVTPTEEPTPTVTPTEEPTPTVTPTEEPTPTVTPTEEPTPTVTPTEEPTPTVTPTEEPTPTVTPTEEPTPTVTPTDGPTPTLMPTSGPAPTISVTPITSPAPTTSPVPAKTVTPTSNPTPASTNTPSKNATPTPTVTPALVVPTPFTLPEITPVNDPSHVVTEGTKIDDEQEPEEDDSVAKNGTQVGEGVSLVYADIAIITAESDEGPSGTEYGKLQAKMKNAKKNSISIKWNKIAGATYTIYGNECGKNKKYKKLATVSGNSYTQKKLKKGKYYKYLVVASKDGKVISTSKTLHITTKGGKPGNDKKVIVKKKKVSLKKNKILKIKAKLKPESKKHKSRRHRGLAYESSDNKVATVTSKGMIKGVGKGTAYIYVYAQDGVAAKIKVIVK